MKPPNLAMRQIASPQRASAPPRFQNFVLLVCFRGPLPYGGTRMYCLGGRNLIQPNCRIRQGPRANEVKEISGEN